MNSNSSRPDSDRVDQQNESGSGSSACYPSGDRLRMDYINSLPQPFIARMIGGGDWPVEDIEVQTGLIRCDIVGKLQVFTIIDVSVFIDSHGVEHDPDTFWIDG